MTDRKRTPIRAPCLYLLAGIIGGLNVARLWDAPLLWLLSGSGGLTLAALLTTKQKKLWPIFFIAASTMTFWAYGILRIPQPPDPATLLLPPREANLTLEIRHILQDENRFGETTGIAKIISAPDLSRLSSKTSVYFGFKFPKDQSLLITQGLRLKATGVLTPVLHDDTHKFNGYLKNLGIHYRFNRVVKIEIVQPPPFFNQFCKKMNEHFQSYLCLGEPEGSGVANIYSAMLLGRTTELTQQQMERYRMTGTLHFFAISGLHIGVIATVIFQILNLIRVPREWNPMIGLPLLFLYVEITGAAPSAVRAFLMTAFFWASFACRRQRNALAALTSSAILVLLIQPTQLWGMGFQLSYCVVLSILLLGLPLYERLQFFQWLPKDSWTPMHRIWAWSGKKLCLLFAISFSAWLASMPMVAVFFGFIAPGSILLNMLLVNLAALAIITGVLSLSAALFLPAACTFINHSAWIAISLMDKIIILFTHVPGTVIDYHHSQGQSHYLALALYFSLLFWHHNQSSFRWWRLLAAPMTLIGIVAIAILVE